MLLSMEDAGNHGTGIGTPATRAETIETLVKRGYLKRSGTTLSSTPRGQSLIQQVPAWLKSPNTTSQWEHELNKITATEDDLLAIHQKDLFTAEQKNRITQLLKQNIIPKLSVEHSHQADAQSTKKPSEKMIKFIHFIARKRKIKPPKDYLTSWKSCQSFIKKYATDTKLQ
jgi:hypothetical protein